MTDLPSTDFRKTEVGRRQSWRGAKKPIKWLLGLRLPNALMRIALRLRPQLRANGRLPAPAHLSEVVGKAGSTSFVMLGPKDCEVAKELYWGRGRRPRPNDQFALELFTRLAPECRAVFDIGAYTGIFTLSAGKAAPDAALFAFEMVPEVFVRLFENCARNNLLLNTRLNCLGIGSPGARARFPMRSGGASLPSFYSPDLTFSEGPEVRIEPLDAFDPDLDEGDDVLMKVDVEGSEWDVIRHGRNLLQKYRVHMICEVLPGARNVPDLSAFLVSLGYRTYLVRNEDLLLVGTLRPDGDFRDWFFSPLDVQDLRRKGIVVRSNDD
jgi:FkbM family methyltransferase